MASEAMSLTQLADERHFVGLMAKETFGLKTLPVFCKTKNKSLEENLKSLKVTQDLRLSLDFARLLEMVKLSKIEVQHVEPIYWQSMEHQ